MLGVPASIGGVGWSLLALGALAAAGLAAFLRRRVSELGVVAASAAICLIATAAATPYIAWRVVEDLRLTTGLHGYDARAAGPVQAYLPGYLVDGAQSFIPRDATYATATGAAVPWPTARAAFPSLALQTLFPRRSVADPEEADYLLAWGVAPRSIAPVTRVWVVRPRTGRDPAVLVARVRH